MDSIRTVTSITLKNGTIRSQSLRWLLSNTPATGTRGFDRYAHTQDVTKNIQYISNDKMKLVVDPQTMKLDRERNRPLCILMSWLLARHKHIMKYASIYLEQGFDVLSISCSPRQLMWPTKGVQLVAKDMLNFFSSNEDLNPLALHAFSVGGYIWSEMCVHAIKDKERYQPVLDRVAAQVWDSVADISELTIGVPNAIFPKNKFMQKTLKAYMEYHLRTFYDAATVHYIRASQVYYATPCRAPALYFLSRTDPVGAERTIRSAFDSWVKMGVPCTWKCWDKSPHVQHFTYHKEEYLAALYAHLEANGLLSQPEKMRMRL